MITKKQSVMIQGIAVLLMMYHHFFLDPSELAISYGNIELVKQTAWFGKICVGMFAFVSGYGVFYGFSALKREQFFTTLWENYRKTFVRMLRVFGKYWYVLLIFKGIDFIIRKEMFYPVEFWENFFAIKVTYNGTWWYMQQYVLMMLLAPLLHLLLEPFEKKERRKKCIFYGVLLAGTAAIGFVMWGKDPEMFNALIHGLRPSFLAIFLMGYLFSRFSVYERIRIENLSGILKIIIGLGLIAAMVVLRIQITPEASFARYDFVIVPVFVTGVLLVMEQVKILAQGSFFVGRYATYMWLIHISIFYYTRKLCLQYISQFFLFYVVQVGITLAVAWLMKQGEIAAKKQIVPRLGK